MKAVRELSLKWPGSIAKLIEDKANGSAVIQMLAHEIPGILPVNPEGGKVARAAAVSPLVEAGNVYLPHPQYALWVNAFYRGMCDVPQWRQRRPGRCDDPGAPPLEHGPDPAGDLLLRPGSNQPHLNLRVAGGYCETDEDWPPLRHAGLRSSVWLGLDMSVG